MLRTLFQWFDAHPESYWAIAAVPTVPWLFFALISYREVEPRGKKSAGNEFIFIFLLLATLVAWRWPTWLNADPYNPDESQFVAGALTLTQDPVFWRSVDGTTSGPLNFYALLPLHWLGLPLDYFEARVTALLLVWAALLGCYRLVHSLHGRAPARFAILPLTAFFLAAADADFVHYSSEHVSLALVAISASCLFGAGFGTESRRELWLGGLLAGMLPWAKLQTTPIAATLVGIGFWMIWKKNGLTPTARRRGALELILAACLPGILIITVVAASGHAADLFRDYFLQNFHYLNQEWSLAAALRGLWAFSMETGNYPVYVGTVLGLIVFASASAGTREKKYSLSAGVLTLVAALCVIAPKRAFLHYALLTLVPLSLWMGILLGELWRMPARFPRGKFLAAILATGAFCAVIGVRLSQGAPKMFGQFSEHWRHPRSAAGNIVRSLTSSRDRLAIWGWMERIHVDARLAQATRESKAFQQITPSPQREHYRERYVHDLKKSLPAVFIDATGRGAPVFNDRSNTSHETVPALAEFISTNYRLLIDLDYARIYVRTERLREHPVSPTELWRLIAESRRDETPFIPSSVLPKRLRTKKIAGRTVQMMLPPAQMTWDLEGTEREVFLEYGFDPKAYEDGNGNGAEILAEIHPPDSPPRLLFKRTLDPVKRMDDRGNLVSKIVLPPFPAGSKFVVRTTPGEFGDNAWDWIYVGRLDRVRAPFFSPSQFPGYARVPDSIVSEYTSLLDTNGEKLLMTHAPTSMQFSLKGDEHRWQFDYGFQPSAYTGEGHTDGATFIVELKRGNQPPVILFSRRADPAKIETDRDNLHENVALPPVEAGDQLVMRIDPGQSIGWDWTYFTHLQIEDRPK